MKTLEACYEINFNKFNFQERKVAIRDDYTILIGPPKSGKSYLIYDYLSNKMIGEIITSVDMENEKKNFNAMLDIVIISISIIILMILYIYYEYIKVTTKRIEDTINEVSCFAITDDLTQLYNRRYYNDIFPKMLQNAIRYSHYVSFFMIDIDNFKLYNDTYGHYSGDVVLKEVAKVIKNNLKRDTDLSCRLGGEEFAVFITNKEYFNSKNLAQKIIDDIFDLNLYHEHNEDFGRITISIGIQTQLAQKNICMNDLYKKADEFLYIAKDNGRNQIKFGELI